MCSRAKQNLQPQLSCFCCPNHPLPSAPTPSQGLGFCPNLPPRSTAWHTAPNRNSLPLIETINQVCFRYNNYPLVT